MGVSLQSTNSSRVNRIAPRNIRLGLAGSEASKCLLPLVRR